MQPATQQEHVSSNGSAPVVDAASNGASSAGPASAPPATDEPELNGNQVARQSASPEGEAAEVADDEPAVADDADDGVEPQATAEASDEPAVEPEPESEKVAPLAAAAEADVPLNPTPEFAATKGTEPAPVAQPDVKSKSQTARTPEKPEKVAPRSVVQNQASFPSAPAVPPLTVPSPVVAMPRWLKITGISLCAVLLITFATCFGIYSSWLSNGRLAPGLIIQGQPVGGLNQAQARARLEEHFGRLFLTLGMPERDYHLAVHELGGDVQIERAVRDGFWYGRSRNIFSNMWTVFRCKEDGRRMVLPVRWNREDLKKKLFVVAAQYDRIPHNASLKVGDHGVTVVPERAGRVLNVPHSMQALQHEYYAGLRQVAMDVKVTKPSLLARDLEGVDRKLGEYTTRFDSGIAGRTHNIHLVSQAVNGRVVMPGQPFSFNACTGERTADKGYRMAHIFIHKAGEAVVVEGLGGGTCQVSSTLFNAVRKTNNGHDHKLKITERNFHSLPVTYVPSGLDATVAWPDKDFKFRNRFPHPIYLRTRISGEHLTISVWGRIPKHNKWSNVPIEEPASLQVQKPDKSRHARASSDDL